MNILLKTREIKNFKIYYDILMALLAIIIIASLVLQNKEDLTIEQSAIIGQINFSIWIIFIADYIIRLILATNKISFFRKNIIDLLSILPFDTAFQGLRIARLVRVFYMLRVFIYLTRVYKRLGAILTTNNFHHVLWFTFLTIFCGAMAITFVDDMDIGDALWWSFVTTTTVGYGDIAPSSIGGRIIAICYDCGYRLFKYAYRNNSYLFYRGSRNYKLS